MHLLAAALEAPEVREEESVQSLVERNRWWLEYLTDEDLRIEYARQILVRREEREMDQDVVDYYDQQYEEYFQGHDFSLFFYWWGVCFELFVSLCSFLFEFSGCYSENYLNTRLL